MILALLTACTADPPPPHRDLPPPEVTADPELLPADPVTPLARTLLLETDRRCTVTATWSDEGRTRTTTGAPGRQHEVPLVGMRADTDYVVELALTDPEGRTTPAGELAFRSEPLPTPFPDLAVTVSDPARMEPGDTMIGFASNHGEKYTVVLDPAGAVVWVRDDSDVSRLWELRPQEDGSLLGYYEYGDVVRMDWLGEVSERWSSNAWPGGGTPVPVGTFHHEIRPIGDDLLALTHETITVPDYPLSYADPTVSGEAEVSVDHVVRFRRDGSVVWDHDLSEVLDLGRIGWYSLWLDPQGYDWSHANSAAEHLEDGGIVISSRHQDAVFEIDGATGALRWILANPDNWSPELDAYRLQPIGEPFEWPYHQHAAEPGEDGRILLFDNGNDRTSPWTGAVEVPLREQWSRVVEYRVDEEARTVEQLWEFQPPQRLWSGAEGNAERGPVTGNVLSLWGFVTHVDGVHSEGRGLGEQTVRVIEFVPETGEILFDLELSSPIELIPTGWNAYRAHRIPAL